MLTRDLFAVADLVIAVFILIVQLQQVLQTIIVNKLQKKLAEPPLQYMVHRANFAICGERYMQLDNSRRYGGQVRL